MKTGPVVFEKMLKDDVNTPVAIGLMSDSDDLKI